MKLIGIGDSIFDAYLEENKLYPGGNAVNTAVLAKRYGAQSAGYIGVLGDDAPGRYFLKTLMEENIDVSRVRVVHGESAQNYIRLTPDGDRGFVGNNCDRSAQGLVDLHLVKQDYDMLGTFDVAHTSLHSRLDESIPVMARRTELSLDFSGAYTERIIERFCPFLRFAFFSAGDQPDDSVKSLARYALECGASTVVVTRGGRGAYLAEKDVEHQEACYPVKAVDALGAGDAFIAAFITEYVDSRGDLRRAASKASFFAAQCCLYHGAFGRPYPL